jgi:hypothetical protein
MAHTSTVAVDKVRGEDDEMQKRRPTMDEQDKIEERYFNYSGAFPGRIIPEDEEVNFAGSERVMALIAWFKKERLHERNSEAEALKSAEEKLVFHRRRVERFEMLSQWVGDHATMINEDASLPPGQIIEYFKMHFEWNFETMVIQRVLGPQNFDVDANDERFVHTMCMLLLDKEFGKCKALFNKRHLDEWLGFDERVGPVSSSSSSSSSEKRLQPEISESEFRAREWLLKQMFSTQMRVNNSGDTELLATKEVRAMAVVAMDLWTSAFYDNLPTRLKTRTDLWERSSDAVHNWIYRAVVFFWFLISRNPAMGVRIPRVGDELDPEWMERHHSSRQDGYVRLHARLATRLCSSNIVKSLVYPSLWINVPREEDDDEDALANRNGNCVVRAFVCT